MDQGTVINLINRINSGDTASAEAEIESLRAANPDALVTSLFAVVGDPASATPVIQAALLILKSAVIPKSWSIGFEDFVGPALSPDVKSSARAQLLGLLGFPKSKVRSVAALLVSSIAAVEFPDEWPELLGSMLSLIENGNEHQVYGALAAVKELVSDTLSEVEFIKVGQAILSTIYKVAASPQLGDNKYSPHAAAIAIEVFRQCIDFFLIAEDTKSPLVDTVAAPIIDQWSPLFVHYVGYQSDQNAANNQESQISAAGDLDLKLESLKTFKALLSALPRLAHKHVPGLFQATLTNLFHTLPAYERYHINNDSGEEPPIGHGDDGNVFIHPNLTIDNLVLEELDFIDMAVELRDVIIKVSSILRDFVTMLVRLAQIPNDQENTWEDDMDEFVLEESELAVGRLVRTQVADILVICGKSRQFSLLPILWDNAYTLTQEFSHSWKIKESCLFLFSRVIAEGTTDTTALPGESLEQFVQFASECQQDQNPLLRSRAILAAASVTRSLSSRIDRDKVKVPLFEATLNAALSDPNDTVRISGVIAIPKYCNELPQEYFEAKETALYQAIYLMSEKAQDDTPAILAEVLVAIIERDISRAARNTDVVKLVYKLVAKDPTNVMLTNEVQDIMAEIAETATDEGIYNEFIQHAIEPLVSSIMSINDWEYSPELVLSLNILSVLVDKAPFPMPEEIVTTFFEPLYEITMNSSDNQVLQAVSEILSYFTQHAPEQIKNWTSKKEGRNGIELLILAVARLLDPAWTDSASVNTGMLILAIVQNFGALLGDLLPQILDATVKRLATAKNPALIENFILVFSKLVGNSAADVVNILAKIEIDQDGVKTNGLEVVLKKWLSNFDVLRGYDEIKENVISLGQLYQLNDSRITSIIVEGDPLPVAPNVIMTRSRAKQQGENFTRIPASAKIVKLFLRELIVGQAAASEALRSAAAANMSADSLGGGDDWEDLDGPAPASLGPGMLPLDELLKYAGEDGVSDENGEGAHKSATWAGSDNSTQRMIADWIRNVVSSNIGNFSETVLPHLSGEEREFLSKLMEHHKA